MASISASEQRANDLRVYTNVGRALYYWVQRVPDDILDELPEGALKQRVRSVRKLAATLYYEGRDHYAADRIALAAQAMLSGARLAVGVDTALRAVSKNTPWWNSVAAAIDAFEASLAEFARVAKSGVKAGLLTATASIWLVGAALGIGIFVLADRSVRRG